MVDIEIIKSKLVGANLKSLLIAKKTNKWRVHRDCFISYQTLCNWQAKRSRPSDALALRVAKYLGLISPDDFELAEIKKEQDKLNAKIQRLTSE